MTALPAELRAELRANLRKKAGEWIAKFYRHELLVARSVRGMQIEAQQEFDRAIVQPLLRQIGGRLSAFEPRGQDVVAAVYPELQSLEREIQSIVARGSDSVRRLATERLEAMTRHETEWVQESARKVLGTEPVATASRLPPTDRPILGQRTEEWFKGMLDTPTGDKVRAWVNTGIQRGLTTDEIVRGLRGTRTQAGILEAPRHAVAALVRTAATSASSQARIDSFHGIGVTHWKFVATLDHRTSVQCAAHDGKVFPLGKGPVPPLHPNCRSTAVPDFGGEPLGTRASQDGQVPADKTFPEWLQAQPIGEQNRVLGATKAKAWRAGKLTIEQMLGRDLQPLTLAELRDMDRL